jgi:uncharacterized protein with FMN-binding domain
MPRAATALVLTVIATVLLFSFRPTPGKVSLAAPVASAPAPRSPARSSGDRHRRPHTHATHAPTPATSPTRRRTVVGTPVQDPYGTVQVEVMLAGHRIVDVRPVQLPLSDGHSQAVNSQAAPLLRAEVLRAQSARIDVVSGATYTSEAYAQSLQAALSRA